MNTKVQIGKHYQCKIVISFLPANINICLGAKKNRFIETVLLSTVIPVAITAIYLSRQGVSDLGYTRAHVSFNL